jgi:hypothetical protein
VNEEFPIDFSLSSVLKIWKILLYLCFIFPCLFLGSDFDISGIMESPVLAHYSSPTIGKGPCREDAKALAAGYYSSYLAEFYYLAPWQRLRIYSHFHSHSRRIRISSGHWRMRMRITSNLTNFHLCPPLSQYLVFPIVKSLNTSESVAEFGTRSQVQSSNPATR